MVNILHVGCKYNTLYITYFIVLSAAANIKCEILQNVTKIHNVLLQSRRFSFVYKPLFLFQTCYGSCPVNISHLLVNITKYILCSHIVQFGCRDLHCIMCHHALSRRQLVTSSTVQVHKGISSIVSKASALLLYVLHDCEKWVKISSILLLCTMIKYIIQMHVTDTKDIEFKPYFTGFHTSEFSYRNNNDIICIIF